MTKEEAIELLEDLDGAIEDNHGRDYDEAFRNAIESLSADEIVRCKDCRHRNLFSCPLEYNDFKNDDDYCSWGERRKP